MSDISMRQEISPITKKTSLLSLGKKSARQNNCRPIEFADDNEETRCYEEDDCFERDIKHDTRSEDSAYGDVIVITNDCQPFDVSQINDEEKSENPELEGHQAQRSGQILRGKGTNDVLNFQKYQDTHYHTKANSSRVTVLHELGKNRIIMTRKLDDKRSNVDTVIVNIRSTRQPQRIMDLYELGKNRVISHRAIAATNLHAVDNLAANVAALSKTKLSVSEIAGQRLFIQAKQSAERKEKLRQLVTDTHLQKMEASIYGKWYRVTNHRTTALYELGKDRVMTRRQLALDNANFGPGNIKIGTIKLPQRVFDLYELGRRRVIINRKVAAAYDNLTTNVISISDTKTSPSEIAGQRLFIQAKLSAERIAKLRQKAEKIPVPQLELETRKRCHAMPMESGKSVIERFSMLSEKGRSRIIAERELEIKNSDNTVNVNEKVDAGYASTRQLKLYMKGRQKIINERLVEKKHSDVTNLYMYKSYGPFNEIAPNATMVKLYALSKMMREHGKRRREKIVNERLEFPIIKVYNSTKYWNTIS